MIEPTSRPADTPVSRAGAQHPSSQRGQVLVLVALALTVFIGVAALVVDYGYWLAERRTLQNAADAAALAGVNQLRPPLDSTSSAAAAYQAVADLNRQLGLGISDLTAAAAAATGPGGLTASSGVGYTGGDRFVLSTPPNPDCGGPGSYVGNRRAITVSIDHLSDRFFSGIYSGGDQHVSVCATAASRAGAFAIAVLAPPGQSQSSQLTFTLAGANTIINLSGGDAAVNSTFAAQGNPCPNPPCHVQPAVLHFTTAGNVLYLGDPNPSPLPWTISPAQITDPVGSYLPPVQLPARIGIPGWGPYAWSDGAGGTYDPGGSPASYSGPTPPAGQLAGTCVDPLNPSIPGLKPGNYNQIALGQGQRLWLCPGVFHIVAPTTGQPSLQMAQTGVLAGQGVTLAFEADAEMSSNAGSMIYLNSTAAGGTPAPAPWHTGDPLHDVPIAIWVRPVSDCDPFASAPCSDSSKVFWMAGGAGIDETGIIYGPTDNMQLSSADTTQASAAGEIWAWTLTYTGQATLDQVFSGPDVSYPTLVQ